MIDFFEIGGENGFQRFGISSRVGGRWERWELDGRRTVFTQLFGAEEPDGAVLLRGSSGQLTRLVPAKDALRVAVHRTGERIEAEFAPLR